MPINFLGKFFAFGPCLRLALFRKLHPEKGEKHIHTHYSFYMEMSPDFKIIGSIFKDEKFFCSVTVRLSAMSRAIF